MTEIENKAAGLSPEFGIDRHFLQLAHAQGKEIIEIESSASQYDAMNRIPDKGYEFIFSSYIFQTADSAGDSLKNTYAAWKSGTMQNSIEIIDEDAADEDESGYTAALSDYYRILFTERNTVMTNAAESYLDNGKKVFFIVGAEHLLGSSDADGIDDNGGQRAFGGRRTIGRPCKPAELPVRTLRAGFHYGGMRSCCKCSVEAFPLRRVLLCCNGMALQRRI